MSLCHPLLAVCIFVFVFRPGKLCSLELNGFEAKTNKRVFIYLTARGFIGFFRGFFSSSMLSEMIIDELILDDQPQRQKRT